MSKLLEDLDGQIVLNQTDESIIGDILKIYLSFTLGSNYEKRVKQEIRSIFEEKKSNKSYFFPPPKQNYLKSIGFNQVIHILVRKLWDEEDFFRITKNPSQISFISSEVQDIHQASISLSDVQKFIANQNVFPFISNDISFFSKSINDQTRKSIAWIKSGNSVPKFIERIRLIGAYIQTVFFGSQALFEIAKEYESTNQQVEEKITENKKSLSETDVKLVAVLSPGAEALSSKIDSPLLVDILLYEIKNIFKNPENLNIQESLKQITLKIKSIMPEVTEKHITLVYLLMKEIAKTPEKNAEDFKMYFTGLAEKLRITYKEILTIFYLIKSDNDLVLSKTSLVEFVEICISEDSKGILSENHVKILRSLFSNLPKEIKANHFYSVKEKLKLKIEDPVKRKIVDTLTELIHLKVRDLRTKWALQHLE